MAEWIHFFDHTGSYTPGFANAALAGGANVLLLGSLLLMRRRRAAVAA